MVRENNCEVVNGVGTVRDGVGNVIQACEYVLKSEC